MHVSDRTRTSDVEQGAAASAFDEVRVVAMRAGSVLAMSDRVLHCSGPNATGRARRAWMPQFSAGAMTNAQQMPVALAVPLRNMM